MQFKIGKFSFTAGRTEARTVYEAAQESYSVNTSGLFRGLEDKRAIAPLYFDSINGSHAVFSIINMASDVIADTMNYVVHKDSKGEIVEDSAAVNSLNNPNEAQTLRQFFKAYAVNRLLFGEAYVYALEKVGLDAGRFDLNVAYSQDVSIDIDGIDWLHPAKKLKVQAGGKTTSYDIEKFVCVKNYNPDSKSPYGLSPLYPAAILAKKILKGDAVEYNAFEQGGIERLITPKSNENAALRLNVNDMDTLDEELNKVTSNKRKAISKPIETHNIKDTPIDLGVLQSTEAATKALMFVYKLPYTLFSGDGTFNNTAEGYKALYTIIGIPYAQEFLDAYSKFIKLERGQWLDIETDKIPHLQRSQLDTMTALEKANASINEKRSAAGLPPLAGEQYDQPIIPMGVTLGYEEIQNLEV